jgi:hypothetical protein
LVSFVGKMSLLLNGIFLSLIAYIALKLLLTYLRTPTSLNANTNTRPDSSWLTLRQQYVSPSPSSSTSSSLVPTMSRNVSPPRRFSYLPTPRSNTRYPPNDRRLDDATGSGFSTGSSSNDDNELGFVKSKRTSSAG